MGSCFPLSKATSFKSMLQNNREATGGGVSPNRSSSGSRDIDGPMLRGKYQRCNPLPENATSTGGGAQTTIRKVSINLSIHLSINLSMHLEIR